MTADVPQITPATETGSLLIPKISLESTATANNDQASVQAGQDSKQSKFAKLLPKFRKRAPKEQVAGDGMNPKAKKILVWVSSIVGILLILVGIVGFLVFNVYKKALTVRESVSALVAAGQSQDLNVIKAQLADTRTKVDAFKGSYKLISWMRILPWVGGFVSDGQHVLNASDAGFDAANILLATIEPYADIIGLTGGGSGALDGDQTAQERIDFIVKTIPELTPRADELASKFAIIQSEFSYIDPARYPQEFRGVPVRAQVKKGLDLVNTGAKLVENAKPLLESAPYLLGIGEERTYLILFQNDKEERPTGGFLTAYSVATVKDGKFQPVSSNDIYNLDTRYTPALPAPQPIVDYIKGPYILSKNLRLRDMNWSPDFSVSMAQFAEESDGLLPKGIDGIIAVDTQLLVNLLDVLGTIGVPGFGNFSNEIIPECNCPQVIHELESFADVEGPIIWDPLTGEIILKPANSDNRKAIIGPLMNSVLSNTLGQPKEKIPGLFEAAFKSLVEKHVLFYIYDDTVQDAVAGFGIGGTIDPYDGDYLHINDANLGGRKSNLYVTQEVNQVVNIANDGTVTKTVTITYNNPEDYDGWLNSVLPNWVRVYVPQGSELVDVSGLDDKADPYDELGKTVFSGGFELRPKGVSKVEFTYKLPFKVTDEYNLLVQKQPSKSMPLYSIEVGKQGEELFLRQDKEFRFKI